MSRHDVLILGMSSLVQRRVLPALLGLERIGKVHIASRSLSAHPLVSDARAGRLWNDYASALEECAPCLAYISLPNSMHAEWVEIALSRGFHVVVDKPAVNADHARACELAKLAAAQSCVLAEANVWLWHPMANSAKEAVASGGAETQAIVAVFTSPSMNPDNFRYRRDLGGGALLDRGPYAASCGRFFFNEQPINVSCEVLSRTGSGDVDAAFSAVLRYSRGILLGYFSLESEYQNRVEIISEAVACSVERVFTPPADFAGSVSISTHNRARSVDVPAQDSFAVFLDDVINAIERRDFLTHSRALIDDARVLQLMCESAEG